MPKEAIIGSDIEREKLVRDIIISYGKISQNILLRIIVNDKKLMAGNTFRKTLKSLREKRQIDFHELSNKKIWFNIDSANIKKLVDLEKYLKRQEKKISIDSKKFAVKTLAEKTQDVIWIFSLFEANSSFNSLMFGLDNMPKEQYDKVSRMMEKFLKLNLEIWKNDKDAEYLIPELIQSIIKTSPFFSDMLQVLDEYREINWSDDKKET